MRLNSTLMFSPEFNLERELCSTSVLSSHTSIITQTLIRQVKKEIKGIDVCYIKGNLCKKKNGANAYYLNVYASEYSYNR